MNRKKIVLAYSGGLDTSVAIKWLDENYGYDVIAVAADLGEGKDLAAIQQRALQAGAADCHILNLKEVYSNQYIAKALKANALYEGVYPLISALSRPLIAKCLVEIASSSGAEAVSHGCTGKGNDQVRFDISINTLDPDLKIVAPVRESPMSREQAIAYAEKHGMSLPIKKENPFSIDLNLWGRSCECGVLEDPWATPPEAAYAWTQAIEDTPQDAAIVELQFDKGLPTHMNGEKLSLQCIIEKLNVLAGQHGVGRIDHVENRLVGIKSREIYEAPAAMTLIQAHQSLESLCLTRNVLHYKQNIEKTFANLVYDGMWYSPLLEAVNAFIDKTQENVNGTVRMKLHKGHSIVEGRKSEKSLYQMDLATYKENDSFDHAASEGFIKIMGLPLKVDAKVNKKQEQTNEVMEWAI